MIENAAQLAAIDQEGAELRAHLDHLVQVYAGLVAEVGAVQGVCDLTAFCGPCGGIYDHIGVAGLLAVAVQRLAEGATP